MAQPASHPDRRIAEAARTSHQPSVHQYRAGRTPERMRGGLAWFAVPVPGAVIALMAFNSGGYFPVATGVGVVGMLTLLALTALIAPERIRRPSASLVVFVGALVLYAAWVLASSTWASSAGRALVELDRALLYVFAALFAGLTLRSVRRLRIALELAALALVVICAFAVIVRLRPDIWSADFGIAANRLSYPVSYWNGLGLLAAIGALSCVHLSADLATAPWKRCLAAGALPVPVVALVFTFSRGAIALLAVGLTIYLLMALSRGTVPALLAALPVGLAVHAAYGADALASLTPTSRIGIQEGREVFESLGISAVLALGLRAGLTPLDRAISQISIRPLVVRGALTTVVLALVGGAAAFVVSDAGERVRASLQGSGAGDVTDARTRLTSVSNAARQDLWRVSQRDFRADRLRGAGAGSFANSYSRHRRSTTDSNEGHSLYFETLGELGVVGLALLALMLLVGLAAAIRPRRRLNRGVFSLVLAGSVTWALGAALDWQWELPVVSLWPVMALAAVTGIPRGRSRTMRWAARRSLRPLALVPLVLLALLPIALITSQRELERGLTELAAGRPGPALAAANAARQAVGGRPEAHELRALSAAALGREREAVAAARAAVRRDRDNWEVWYTLALVHGQLGRDPLPPLRAAIQRNPLRLEPTDLRDALLLPRPRPARDRARLAGQAPTLVGASSSPLGGPSFNAPSDTASRRDSAK